VDIKALGESGLIKRIAAAYGAGDPSIACGIGDDAAVLRLTEDHLLLTSCDLLIEQVHFDLGLTDALSLGTKSLAVNLSDIAAMGGIPRFFLVSLGLPPHLPLQFVDDLYRGMMTLAGRFNTRLAGGDTNASPLQLVIDITILGEIPPDQAVRRCGARGGNSIWVTGTLGDSSLGLNLLRRERENALRSPFKALAARHLTPVPRVREGRMLAETHIPSSMIDVSDGLLADLSRLLAASDKGATIALDRLPLSEDFLHCPLSGGERRIDYALSGGEDYELLFTAANDREGELLKLAEGFSVPVTKIGEITDGGGLVVLDSKHQPYDIGKLGFDHFSSAGK
jgi:thiamine-monophosphate kinase